MSKHVRCPRCHGRRKMYKKINGYSMVDTGGIEVECPMCLGKGEVKSLLHEISEREKIAEEKISDDEPKKEKRKYEKKSQNNFYIHPHQKSLNVETGEIE